MTTTEQLQNTLTEKRKKLAADANFQKLQEFYRQKSEQGAVVKKEYTLPQLDTVGREIYHLIAPRKESA